MCNLQIKFPIGTGLEDGTISSEKRFCKLCSKGCLMLLLQTSQRILNY